MGNISPEEQRKAKENLEKAFTNLKRRHMSFSSKRPELAYKGISSLSRLHSKYKYEIDDLIRYIEKEEKNCDEYLHRYCPDFYAATANSRISVWRDEKDKTDRKQNEKALERIKKAIENIDSYAKRKSSELSKDFLAGFSRRLNDVKTHGLGRPWRTEIHQRLAFAAGLNTEINNLWTLGLNSLTNSKNVYLGDHFLGLLKKDGAMRKVISEMEEKIIADIKKSTFKAPCLTAQNLDNRRFNGRSRSHGFGRTRHEDNMFTQLKTTILTPFESATKYAATWNVGLNELTWSIRNVSVNFNGVYHTVYNVAGFAFIWEIEFSIEDTLDLRPRSGAKIDFGGQTSGEQAYNTVNSILSTVYHDLIGNTDHLKVRAHWTDHGNGNDKIHSW